MQSREKVLLVMLQGGSSETCTKCIFPKCLFHHRNPILTLLFMLESGGTALSQEMGTTALGRGIEHLALLL